MLVGVIFEDYLLDIVLPADKVRVVIVEILSAKNKVSKEKAKAIFNQHEQEYFEKKFEDEIKKAFSSYIKKEIRGWKVYEDELKKRKKGRKKCLDHIK